MRALVVMALLLGSQGELCSAGPNAGTTIPLHTVAGFLPCSAAGDPCSPPALDTEMELGVLNAVAVYVRNYHNVAYVQTAFDWPPSWTLPFGLLCQTSFGGLIPRYPGPATGTLINTFDCVTGGSTQVIAVLHFIPSLPGCLEQIESAYPNGTHVASCVGEIDAVPSEARGKVCAGGAGTNRCDLATPASLVTWGRIKQQYQR